MKVQQSKCYDVREIENVLLFYNCILMPRKTTILLLAIVLVRKADIQ